MPRSPSRNFAPAGTTPQYAPPRTFDLTHLRLALEIDLIGRTLRGRAALRLSPLVDGCKDVRLDLASALQVRAVRMLGGRALRWEHREDKLEIGIGRAHPAGRPLEIEIDYGGTPRRGLYFVGPDATFPSKPYQAWTQGQDEDSKHWFPCHDSPNDKATTEILVTVEKPYRVVSNGRLVAIREQPRRGTRTFHWREEFPHPAYLVSVVVGEFVELHAKSAGTPLLYAVPPGQAAAARRTFARTPAMLRFFSNATGYPYPFEKYAQVVVHDFIFGGMENLTATTLTDAVLLDATAALDFHSDSLLAHELAHQWWGNLVTCKEWSHAWLNEGFATYFDALFAEHHRGRDEFLWLMQANARDYFQEDSEKYRRPLVERRYTKPIEIFDRHLYEKGALVLHMLRHELGDALFWKAIRHYVRKHQFQNVESSDLKVAIEEATGRHLDRFFDQWVYGSGFPVVESSWSWLESEAMVRLQLKQTQVENDGSGIFAFPLDVELGRPGTPERRRLQVDTAEHVAYLPCTARPLWLRVDPERAILMQLRHEQGRDELLAQLRGCRDYPGQAAAAEGLARYVGDSQVRAALAGALRRVPSFAAKRAVALALARLGGAESRDLLIAALTERDPRARRGILDALGEFRHDATVGKALRAHWPRERSYFARAALVSALARTRVPEAYEFLARALDRESFRDVIRSAALRGVGTLEDERGIELATAYAAPGRSRWCRDAALHALAALGRAHPSRRNAIRETLEAALGDSSFYAVLAGIDALGKLGAGEAVAALRRIEQADLDGRLQKAAREAIETLTSRSEESERFRGLQSELERLRGESRELRDRVARLEAAAGRRGPVAPRVSRRRIRPG